jgi:AcrR family transcriptional regulator
MQATSSLPSPTRERLLDAAVAVCAKHGFRGATTREIAAAAAVNEVTLFRHFGSKEKLIAAVVQRSVEAQVEALRATPPGESLEADLRQFAKCFHRLLYEQEPLIRALLGEIHQYPLEARRLISEAALPLRERLHDSLKAAQQTGRVRADLELAPAIDFFTGTLLAEMLRRTGKSQRLAYSAESFLETAVQIFLGGIATRGPKKK